MRASSAVRRQRLSERESRLALKVAHEASLKAGALLKRKYGRFTQLSEKPQAGLVTEADRGAEDLIMRHIRGKFKGHSFLGEESGAHTEPASEFRWIIDPLDGTTNFVHGFPLFCVSIGLEYRGKLTAGVIHSPLLNHTYWARAGHGAYRDGKRIHVSATRKLSQSMLSTGFGYPHVERFKKELETLTRVVSGARALRRTGSAALDLCFVACGQFDGFFERGLAPWDVAAGLVILSEAGGAYSAFNGGPYAMGSRTLAATNGKIHRVLLRALSE